MSEELPKIPQEKPQGERKQVDLRLKAEELIQRLFDKRWPNLAGEIALALNDLESAIRATEECFNKRQLATATNIIVLIIKKVGV